MFVKESRVYFSVAYSLRTRITSKQAVWTLIGAFDYLEAIEVALSTMTQIVIDFLVSSSPVLAIISIFS